MGTVSNMDFFGYCCDLLDNTMASWEVIQLEERKYRVVWDGEEIARCMRIDDALILVKALCEKYFNNRINITLLDEPRAERIDNG